MPWFEALRKAGKFKRGILQSMDEVYEGETLYGEIVGNGTMYTSLRNELFIHPPDYVCTP